MPEAADVIARRRLAEVWRSDPDQGEAWAEQVRVAYLAWAAAGGEVNGHRGLAGGACVPCNAYTMLCQRGWIRFENGRLVEVEREARVLTEEEVGRWLQAVRDRSWRTGDPPFQGCNCIVCRRFLDFGFLAVGEPPEMHNGYGVLWPAPGQVEVPVAEPPRDNRVLPADTGGFNFLPPNSAEVLGVVAERPGSLTDAQWGMLKGRPVWVLTGSGEQDRLFRLGVGVLGTFSVVQVRAVVRREELFPEGSGVEGAGSRQYVVSGPVRVRRLDAGQLVELQRTWARQIQAVRDAAPPEWEFKVKAEKETPKKRREPVKKYRKFGGIWLPGAAEGAVYLALGEREEGGVGVEFVDARGRHVQNGWVVRFAVEQVGGEDVISLARDSGVAAELPMRGMDTLGQRRIYTIA